MAFVFQSSNLGAIRQHGRLFWQSENGGQDFSGELTGPGFYHRQTPCLSGKIRWPRAGWPTIWPSWPPWISLTCLQLKPHDAMRRQRVAELRLEAGHGRGDRDNVSRMTDGIG